MGGSIAGKHGPRIVVVADLVARALAAAIGAEVPRAIRNGRVLRTGPVHGVLDVREQTVTGIVSGGDGLTCRASQSGVEQFPQHAVGTVEPGTGLIVGGRQHPGTVAQVIGAVQILHPGHGTPPVHSSRAIDEIPCAQVVIAGTGVVKAVGRIMHRGYCRNDLVYQIVIGGIHGAEKIAVRTPGHVRHVVVDQPRTVRHQTRLRQIRPQKSRCQ